jgi:ribosomal protein L7/L12
MDADIPQLYESFHGAIRTQERARQLVHLIAEIWHTADPAPLVYIHSEPHKSNWTVAITRTGNMPIHVIKALRDRYRTITLKECADNLRLLQNEAVPWVVRRDIGFEEAQELRRALEGFGAVVEVH